MGSDRKNIPGLGIVEITLESPRQEDIERMIEELDHYQDSLYPPEGNHPLSIDELARSNIRFFVLRRHGQALACGALRIDPAGFGKVKRMFVLPAARGFTLGQMILDRIEEEAKNLGITCLRLETGPDQPEALGLYRKAGFVERGSFGYYQESPYSVFMEKVLYASE